MEERAEMVSQLVVTLEKCFPQFEINTNAAMCMFGYTNSPSKFHTKFSLNKQSFTDSVFPLFGWFRIVAHLHGFGVFCNRTVK